MQPPVDVHSTSMTDDDQQPCAVVPLESLWIDAVGRLGITSADDPADAAQAILDAIERRWWIQKYVVPNMRTFDRGDGTAHQDQLIRHWMDGGTVTPKAVAVLLDVPLGVAKGICSNMPVNLNVARRMWVLDLMIDNPDATPSEIMEMCAEFCPPPRRETIYSWRQGERNDRLGELTKRKIERGLM